MAASLSTDNVPSPELSNNSATAKLLSLAGDALCLAVSALRLHESPRQVSMDEVSYHDRVDDCWIIVFDRVYNVTDFLHKHPGGAEILLEYAGRDASLAFQGIGHGDDMVEVLEEYLVGVLPAGERLFDASGRIRPAKL